MKFSNKGSSNGETNSEINLVYSKLTAKGLKMS